MRRDEERAEGQPGRVSWVRPQERVAEVRRAPLVTDADRLTPGDKVSAVAGCFPR
ncbi:hypothetical protein G6539_13725 [Streptomyces albidoflavus]|nr:hypothetical protein [Streptomyces albidoflavus]